MAKKLGYPDPSDWVTRLHRDLNERADAYQSDKKGSRRALAAFQLASVVNALRELPPFQNDRTLYPLKDILILFNDLENGKKHPWAAPTKTGGTSATTTAQNELHGYVRVVVQYLVQNEYSQIDAYKRVANGLTQSGRSGGGNDPIPWRTVQSWCKKPARTGDVTLKKIFESWVLESEAKMDLCATPPSINRKRLAGNIADQLWTLDHLRDRINSGVSE